MQTIVLHFCYFVLILLFSTAYNTSLIYCFVIWCLHTYKRRPCSSTLSGHPSSSQAKQRNVQRYHKWFAKHTPQILRSLLIGMNIANVDLTIQATGNHCLELRHKPDLANIRTKETHKERTETPRRDLFLETLRGRTRCSSHWKVRALVTQSLWYLTRDLPRIYRSWAPRKRGSVCALQQVYRTNFGVLESWKEIPSTSFFEFGTLFWSSSPRRPVFLQASHQAWALGPSQLHPKGKRSPWRKTTAIADIVKSSEHMCWIRTHRNV